MAQELVIIVAGGVGSRMKSEKPKQFLDISGVPVIVRTINAFLNYNSSIKIIISVHRNFKAHMETLISNYQLPDSQIQITLGGETRFDSVHNGLKLVDDADGLVAIHDAARPLVSKTTIKNCFETAALKGNAIPCIGVNESIRKISNNINNAVNRLEYRIVQTPQVFKAGTIKKAFERGYSAVFTDDATVLEADGHQIFLVEGNPENIKITSPHDIVLAEAMLQNF
jgi:2-C-methyl-D-erythritol 4-phosphate cytidylyltransferase